MMEPRGLVFLMSDEILFSARQTYLGASADTKVRSEGSVVIGDLNGRSDRGNYSLSFSHDTLQQLA